MKLLSPTQHRRLNEVTGFLLLSAGLVALLSLVLLLVAPGMAYGAIYTGDAGLEYRFRGLFSQAGLMGTAAGATLGMAGDDGTAAAARAAVTGDLTGYTDETARQFAHYTRFDSDVRDRFARGELPTELHEIHGRLEKFGAYAATSMSEHDVYRTLSMGGGGYGDPIERDPAAVERDVADGAVSAGRAERVYGVVVGDTGNLMTTIWGSAFMEATPCMVASRFTVWTLGSRWSSGLSSSISSILEPRLGPP